MSSASFRFIRVMVGFLATAISVYAFTFVVGFDLSGYVGSKGQLNEKLLWRIMFFAHTFGGGTALLVGWSQFWKKLRASRPTLHRALGKIYVVCVLFIGGIGGFYLAIFANGGFANALGFSLLAIMWLLTTVQAYLAIRRGEVESHKTWMIRSYALCLAAVTLRLWMPILAGLLSVSPAEAYVAVAWLCWVPNMIIAEAIIAKGWVQ